MKLNHLHLKIPEDFADQVEKLLCDKGLEWISLARKAGVVAIGKEKVKAALLKDKAAFLIHAADGSEESLNKMEAIAQSVETIKVYSSQDFEKILNEQNAVFIAVLKSDIAAHVYKHIKRYQTFLEN